MKSVQFLNWSDEDFTWSWNSDPYKFKSNTSTYMEDWKANHFAKHLVDRELLKKGLPTNHFSREELMKKCIVDEDAIVEASPEKLAMEILNKNKALEKESAQEAKESSREDSKEVSQETKVVKARKSRKSKKVTVEPEEKFEGLETS